MHLTSDFIYFDDDGIQVLGLPYAGEETYMFIILPDERFGLQAVLKKLSGKKLAELVANRETHEVEVRFLFHYTRGYKRSSPGPVALIPNINVSILGLPSSVQSGEHP